MQRFNADGVFHRVFEHQAGTVGDVAQVPVQLFIHRGAHRAGNRGAFFSCATRVPLNHRLHPMK